MPPQLLHQAAEPAVEQLLLAAQGASDAEGGRQAVLLRGEDAQVQRGLHQAGDVPAHGLDAVRQAGEHAEDLRRGVPIHGRPARLTGRRLHPEAGVRPGVLPGEVPGYFLHGPAGGRLVGDRDPGPSPPWGWRCPCRRRRCPPAAAPSPAPRPGAPGPAPCRRLPLPLSISVPEWPPARPRTATSSAVPSKGTRLTGRTHRAMLPPAQLTVKIPSASESRLMSFRPRRGETSSASAPSMPISSSVVNTASSRGWGS